MCTWSSWTQSGPNRPFWVYWLSSQIISKTAYCIKKDVTPVWNLSKTYKVWWSPFPIQRTLPPLQSKMFKSFFNCKLRSYSSDRVLAKVIFFDFPIAFCVKSVVKVYCRTQKNAWKIQKTNLSIFQMFRKTVEFQMDHYNQTNSIIK